MKKVFNILLLLVFLSSCEEEKLPELVNPRFSVAYIQEIDENGVTFAANIYDIGKKEILEYGFFYAQSTSQLVSGERVSASGNPGNFFELTANYALIKDMQYYVQAFVRTEAGVVVSEPQVFTSQGSTGFIFERIELPDNAYYGDTIKIYGKNLSQVLDSYRVKINNSECDIIKLTTGEFNIKIPDQAIINKGEIVKFEFNVAGKRIDVNQAFSLRDPEFEINENRLLDFSKPLVIKGKYLRSSNVTVQLDGIVTQFLESASVITDSTIHVLPTANFPSENPVLKIRIRNHIYTVDKNFKLKPTTLDPNQVFNQNFLTDNLIKIKGDNFNTFDPFFNQLIVDNKDVYYEVETVDYKEIGVRFYHTKQDADFSFNVRVLSLGKESEHSALVNYIEPRATVMNLDHSTNSKLVPIDNKFYYTSNNFIIEVDPISKTSMIKASIPDYFYVHDGNDMFLERQGKLYFTDLTKSHGNKELKNFYEYNPSSNTIVELAPLPSNIITMISFFTKENYIYGIGSFSEWINGNRVIKTQLIRYNFLTQSWEEIGNITLPNFFNILTFNYKDEVYGVIKGNQSLSGLYKFDFSKNIWVEIKSFGLQLNFDSIQHFSQISEEEVLYFGDMNKLLRLDLRYFELKIIDNYSGSFELGHQVDQYFYYPSSRGPAAQLMKLDTRL
jgi:hypothetical protein